MAFPYDQAFKLLTDEDVAGSFTYLVGIDLEPGTVIESLDRELNLERKHADHVYRLRGPDGESIHHLEALTYYRSEWGVAQLEHAVYIKAKYRLPVYSHLLLFHERGTPAVIAGNLVERAGALTQQLWVQIIRVWERPASEVVRSGSLALCPWTALMDATEEEQREAARRLYEGSRSSLLGNMALLGALRYGSIEAFLRRVGRMFMTKELLRDTPGWLEIQREGELIGEARGEARGERRALQRFLTSRFGPLPEWAEAKLATAELEALERWLEQAASAASLESALD